jgi:uncharacterized protein
MVARSRRNSFRIAGTRVEPGESRSIQLRVSERYSGAPVAIPIRVIRAAEDGPRVFVTAAVHGNELNGIGIVRELMFSGLPLECGTLVLAPMVNVFGIEQHTRYTPDRRDLNRSFPGSARGSIASRIAHAVFSEVVKNCEYGIDLHTASEGRTNYPHVRADLDLPGMEEIARAFGCEVVVDGRGDLRTLRSAATRAGCPTLLLEAGEPMKIEPDMVNIGARGVRNVLKHLGMLAGEPEQPPYQTTAQKTMWVRSPSGGLLRFHIAPGSVIEKGDDLVHVDNFLTGRSKKIVSPSDGIVLSMPIMPAVKPGDPICHIAIPDKPVAQIREELSGGRDHLHRAVRRSQATDIPLFPRKR